MDIRKIERPEEGIITERPEEERIEVYPFFGDPKADKRRLGIRGTAIVLSYEEAEELRQALNKRAGEKRTEPKSIDLCLLFYHPFF